MAFPTLSKDLPKSTKNHVFKIMLDMYKLFDMAEVRYPPIMRGFAFSLSAKSPLKILKKFDKNSEALLQYLCQA
jgi:hypothetical protein